MSTTSQTSPEPTPEPTPGPPAGPPAGPRRDPAGLPSEQPAERARRRFSYVLTGVGILAILVATLWMASAGYGTEIRREFGQRRSYDMVKPAVQQAFPGVTLTGPSGFALIMLGARMRQRDDEDRS